MKFSIIITFLLCCNSLSASATNALSEIDSIAPPFSHQAATYLSFYKKKDNIGRLPYRRSPSANNILPIAWIEGTSFMTSKVYNAVLSLVKKKINDPELEILNFSFFGGEPMLALQKIVYPLLKESCKLCQEKNKQIQASFISNGTLISKKRLDLLESIPLSQPLFFQITLDGNKTFHDAIKKNPLNNRGSYQMVFSHICEILHRGMKVRIRFNMTAANIDSYLDVLTDLKRIPEYERKTLVIDFQHVWQDNHIDREDFRTHQKELRDIFLSEGFNVSELKHIDSTRCYADANNHVAVNYNGDIFKCTARDFKKETRDGVILENGNLLWNEQHELREQIKYGNKECRACQIFPLCHGGCSQFKIETKQNGGCIRGYDDDFKRKIIEDRIDFLLEKML